MDNRYFLEEVHFLEQKTEIPNHIYSQADQRMEFKKSEFQSSKETEVSSVVSKFSSDSAKCILEDRMYDLNMRMLTTLMKKFAKDDSEIRRQVENERKSYNDTISRLKVEYESKTQKEEQMVRELITLKADNERMKKRLEEYKANNKSLKSNSVKQREGMNNLEFQLQSMTQRYEKKTKECQDLEDENEQCKEKIHEHIIENQILEKKIESYKRQLEVFESMPNRPENYEELIHTSMKDVYCCLSVMKSTFWFQVKNYFDKLKADFESEILEVRKKESDTYSKLNMQLQDDFETRISEVYALRKEDTKRITELTEENINLNEELGKLKLQIEVEYKSTKEAVLKQANTFIVRLKINRDEDTGIKDQVDFQEALTDFAEQDEDKMTTEKLEFDVGEMTKWFREDPPDFIQSMFLPSRISPLEIMDPKSDTMEQDTEQEISSVVTELEEENMPA